MRKTQIEWRQLTFANPPELFPTIRELHHAAQFVAMLGDCLLPRAEDDAHTSLQWYDDLQGLAGAIFPFNLPVRLALIYESFELRFIDKQHKELTSLKLNGQRKSDVLNWLRETVTYFGGNGSELRPIRHYTISHHATDNGASFRKPDIDSLREMANYRYNASLVLGELAAAYDHPGPVRTWPHHFDTAISIAAPSEGGRQELPNIEAGLAIPDQIIREPYFYVSSRLSDEGFETGTLPVLPEGARWFSGPWTGAILEASQLLSGPDAAAQHELARRFLQIAVDGIRGLFMNERNVSSGLGSPLV